MRKTALTLLCLIAVPGAGLAAGDADKGERVFRKCMACHEVGEAAKAKAGPVLNGIVGRAVAAVEFDYSDALIDLGKAGTVWSEDALAAFLEAPKKYAKGTKMSFAGLRKPADRDDVIAYLATFE